MRALILGPDEHKSIETLVKYAEENVVSLDKIKATIAGTRPPVGDNPQHWITIPNGYRVVYSIEEQPRGKARHLSISIESAKPNSAPNPHAVNEIMERFGFKLKIDHAKHELIGDGHIWVEHNAVNLLEMM